MSSQSNWRWCNRCQSLFFAGNNTFGVCPAGGAHNYNGSGDYALTKDSGSGQPNWRWCNRCQGLFFSANTLGVCAAGGTHNDADSGEYFLNQGSDSSIGQPNWRWCNRCQSLFFAGNNTLGVCPAGGAHNDSSSGNYEIAQSSSAPVNIKSGTNVNLADGNIAGSISLTINSDGSYSFSGTENNSAFVPCKVAVAVLVAGSDGTGYTFVVSGTVGANVFGNNNWSWSQPGTSATIQSNWNSSLGLGSKAWWQVSATVDFVALLNDLIAVAQTAGQVISAVKAIVQAVSS